MDDAAPASPEPSNNEEHSGPLRLEEVVELLREAIADSDETIREMQSSRGDRPFDQWIRREGILTVVGRTV